MTKEQIIQELQYMATQKYLIYLALQEIMLDNYEDATFLKDYDHDLTIKHKNIINSLKRNATKAFRFLEGYDEGWNAAIDGMNTFEMANKVVGILGFGNIGQVAGEDARPLRGGALRRADRGARRRALLPAQPGAQHGGLAPPRGRRQVEPS